MGGTARRLNSLLSGGNDPIEPINEGPAYSPVDTFDAGVVKAAIKEAQLLVPGYTYHGFCRKVTEQGGAAGYLVSIVGKRVLYFGVNGEIHKEYFPGTAPRAN